MVKVQSANSFLDFSLSRKDDFQKIFSICRSYYSPSRLSVWEKIYGNYIKRSRSPYVDELVACSQGLGATGLIALNFCLEWACTSALRRDNSSFYSLFHTLDWHLDVGRYISAVKFESTAGPYLSLTWPGYVGVIQGMAPNRFSIALNQAPSQIYGFGHRLDHYIEVIQGLRNFNIPPTHLIRSVFETCDNFDSAVATLAQTPISIPAIFSITGSRAGEAAIIERMPKASVVTAGQNSISNHWINGEFVGRPRPPLSEARRIKFMEQLLSEPLPEKFSWVVPPILNPYTILAFEANAHLNTLDAKTFSNCVEDPESLSWRSD